MVAIKQLALALVLILLTSTYTGCQTQNAPKETVGSATPSIAVDDTHEDVADVTFLDLTKENIIEWETIDLNNLHSQGLSLVAEYTDSPIPEYDTLVTDRYVFFKDVELRISCIDYKANKLLWRLPFPSMQEEDLNSYQCKLRELKEQCLFT